MDHDQLQNFGLYSYNQQSLKNRQTQWSTPLLMGEVKSKTPFFAFGFRGPQTLNVTS